MSQLLRGIKATYNFFAGDAIILSLVVVAFVGATVLARAMHADNRLIAVAFIAVIVSSLCVTLGREIAGRPRMR